jgi:hypothetical protein
MALIPVSFANAQIPSVEREALIALWSSTDGTNWSDNSGWLGAEGTECTWFGVTCDLGHVDQLNLSGNQLNGEIPPELGNLSNLRFLNLGGNQVSGSIPPELGNLSSLLWLWLSPSQLSGVIPPELGNLSNLYYLILAGNQLSGVIPSELGNLSNLYYLALAGNQLSGVIPPELGNPSNLTYLALNRNRLSGVIPSELGDLSNLMTLNLQQNQLSGDIPAKLETLSTLQDEKLDLRWNALHSKIVSLVEFLNNKQNGGDWQSTQTIAPENLTVDRLGDHTIWLTWDAVSYQSDPGGYEVFSSSTGSGVWTSGGWTEAKTDTTFPITGLDPATTFDLAVVSYTDPHSHNLNLVISDFSPQAMATTANTGCAQPIIEVAGIDPITLSVLGSYDSHLWSTGEITSRIVVNPYFKRWYLVTVTSTGPCEETAKTLVDPSAFIFADGFESGDTSEWSQTEP